MYLQWLKIYSPFFDIRSYAWLYAPKKEAVLFSLRTIIASFLALTIALWMEMDSPKWALMTVWIVSQTSRGETITKSKWRIVGTVIGATVSILIVMAFPQQPFLFWIAIAFWIGGSCYLASLIRGSGSYSVVLAGYTCAIISFTATTNPNDVFMLAMSRGSYIILAVLCQDLVERIFAFNQQKQAREIVEKSMLIAITGALQLISAVLKGDYHAIFQVRSIFSSIASSRMTLEFRKAEMQGEGTTIDHVHATLFSVVMALVRMLHLIIYLMQFKKYKTHFDDICFKTHTYIDSLICLLNKKADFTDHLKQLTGLRWECRQIIANHIFHDTELTCSDKKDLEKENFLQQRILYRALSELLGELEVVLREYRISQNPPSGDTFSFRLTPFYNFRLAWLNGFRVFCVVLLTCLIWEVTAWPDFANAAGLGCMICGRLCLFENSYKFSIGFLKGTVLAMVIAAILSVGPLATANMFELLWMGLFIPFFIGGLAIYNLPTRGTGMSFTIFLSLMMVVDNQSKMNELTFLNTAFSTVAVASIAIFAFRYIAPYSPQRVREFIRQRMLRNIHMLPVVSVIPNPRRWLAVTTDWFVTLMRQFDPVREAALVQDYNRGALAVMVIGMNVIKLRNMIQYGILPETVKDELKVVIRRLSHFRGGRYGRTLLIVKSALRRFHNREAKETNLAQRLEIGTAIACLIPICHVLEKNPVFLNPSYDDHL